MARRPKITNEQILDAAREVFWEKGFSGSTLEIAQRSGISEASIFKRFTTKEELFFAAMGIPETPPWAKELEILCGKGNLKENLTQLCFQIWEFFSEIMPRIMMIRSFGNPLPQFNTQESKPAKELRLLAVFLESEMKLGRLRPCDCRTVAHVLIGSLMNYIAIEQMSGHPPMNQPFIPPNTSDKYPQKVAVFIENLVEIVWSGIAPVEV
ncbi:TetR/AcrR family transcriptional regulator [Nostoc sp. MS1]|uniref:TetR/AcrR family transcriptional regulator n=1 Tax=Nostoc sp. MS1 TaxID=2764711 RepID=UPI001CC6DC34|nr:TetR/AcrR family transcriptional regulator [Nostoc sp. MS1]BCL34310.1 hypothetical protein NSMS1_07570 [Nostoc sp. MS1]